MIVRLTVVISLVLVFAACEKQSAPVASSVTVAKVDAVAPTGTATATADSHVHSVACGCSQGQKCSNLIEVEGKYVPLAGELGLGDMEFCGKTGLKAKVEGEMKDGSFLATSFELAK
jgi:hypothetical protein